jgi:hypothetical protein
LFKYCHKVFFPLTANSTTNFVAARSLLCGKALLRWRFDAARSGNDIGCKLVFEKCQPVAQNKFSLLKPLNLQPITGSKLEQRLYRGIKITMLLPQALKLRLQASALFLAQLFRHAVPSFQANQFSNALY